jgi:Family of unknown function (DUF5723)
MSQKIHLIALAFILLCTMSSRAQFNTGTTYAEHNDMNASRYQPSEMDFGNKQFQVGFNYDFFVGNQFIDYDEIKKYYRENEIDQEDNEVLVFENKGDNIIGFGQNFQLFGFGYQLRTKDNRKLDFAFQIVDKAAGNFDMSETFTTLVFQGNNNSTFRGNWVDLGKTQFQLNYYREFAFNVAFPILYRDQDHTFRIGIRPKYIQGIGALKAERSDIHMFTSENGDEIGIKFDYKYQSSGIFQFNPLNSTGSGMGIDLGVTYFINKNFEVVASLLDLGQVKYTKAIKNFEKKGDTTFQGIEAEQLLSGQGAGFEDFVNELQIQFEPTESEGGDFIMALPTRISLEFQYRTPEKKRRDRRYVSNSVYLTYIQGLNSQPGNTMRPYVALGYLHDFHSMFDVGGLVSYGGFNNFALGAFFAVNIMESVKFGMASDNLTAWVLPKEGTGLDISINMSVSF